MHLGSPILSAEPYRLGIEGLVLIDKLRRMGHPVEYWNMGGGFGDPLPEARRRLRRGHSRT